MVSHKSIHLRYWNNLKGNLIRVGQKLVIYVQKGKENHYQAFDNMSFEEKQKQIGKTAFSVSNKKTEEPIDPSYVYYTVRKGDNLWTIAKKYSGISASNIQDLNNMKNSTSLAIGQKLKIYKKQ